MMKRLCTFLAAAFFLLSATAQGLEPGDIAVDFSLQNVNGQQVSLSDYTRKPGVIVIFTCNHCPYAKAYEERIMALDKKYAPLGFPVVAINPNDPLRVPEDSYEQMQIRAREKGYTFPYLVDETQDIAKRYGATKTPHVYLLQSQSNGTFKVAYVGAIDDSPMDASAAEVLYLENAITALQAGKQPDPALTRAIGCTIKWKE
jgi:peroxiredoxin